LTLDKLQELRDSLDDMIGYLTDNSCSDPTCCGGPYYLYSDFDDAQRFLKAEYGIEYVPSDNKE
jgi:hypothetical protein